MRKPSKMEKRSCWCGRARHPMTSFSLLDISLIPVPRTIPRQHFLRVLCRATGSVEQPWCCMQAGFLLPCSQHAPASGSFGMCIHILLPASQFCLLTLSLGNQGCPEWFSTGGVATGQCHLKPSKAFPLLSG